MVLTKLPPPPTRVQPVKATHGEGFPDTMKPYQNRNSKTTRSESTSSRLAFGNKLRDHPVPSQMLPRVLIAGPSVW